MGYLYSNSRKKPDNYRPKSQVAVVAKLLEKIMRDWINLHLERQKLIRDSLLYEWEILFDEIN